MSQLELFRYHNIAVDLDGTIAELQSSSGFTSCGSILPGAKQALTILNDAGYKILAHTARPEEPDCVAAVLDYFNAHGVPIQHVNQLPDAPWKSSKPLADIYVDDRGYRFQGNWVQTLIDCLIILQEFEVLSQFIQGRPLDCPFCLTSSSIQFSIFNPPDSFVCNSCHQVAAVLWAPITKPSTLER